MKPYCGKCKKQTTWHGLLETLPEGLVVACPNEALSTCCNAELFVSAEVIGKDPKWIEYCWWPEEYDRDNKWYKAYEHT